MESYRNKVKAAQAMYAVNAAPSVFLANESIDMITDIAHQISLPEDVLRAYTDFWTVKGRFFPSAQ